MTTPQDTSSTERMHGGPAGYAIGALLADWGGYRLHAAENQHSGRCLIKFAPPDSASGAEALLDESRLMGVLLLGCVLKPVEVVTKSSIPFATFEYFSGRPLDESSGGMWPQEQVLEVGLAVCRALVECHERGVIHRQLSPGAILHDAATGEVKLWHFVCARAKRRPEPSAALVLNACSAPEQTGLVALEESERTDLYGLGTILYRLLARRYPFETGDPRTLSSRLVAEAPVPVRELRRDVSAGLALLVERLLAKSPLERPRSASDVLVELQQLGRSSGMPIVIRPGRLVGGRMIGRQDSLDLMVRQCSTWKSPRAKSLWVSGNAGLGKSRLLQALERGLRPTAAKTAIGKFDQYRQRPYSAFLDAVRGAVEQILALPGHQLEPWAVAFRAIDPVLRCVLVQQVPLLEAVVGPHHQPLPLGPTETANRFATAVSSLMDALCTEAHPLVLMFDDFQWADDASVKLLSQLVDSTQRNYLVVVVAWRPESLSKNAGAADVITRHASTRNGSWLVQLEPLGQSLIEQLCAETVTPCQTPTALAALVVTHARGNPFLALEVLRELERSGGLRWEDAGAGSSWKLGVDVASLFRMPESSVDFVLERVACLGTDCQRLLAIASCIGFRFEVLELEEAWRGSSDALEHALAEACQEHWILPVNAVSSDRGRSYRFTHDRVQQAASVHCDPDVRAHTLRAVGTALMRRSARDRESVFRAADYLFGVALESTGDRAEVAGLMRTAGEFAKQDVAYARAAALFSHALELIAGLGETVIPELEFACQLQRGESLYLAGELTLGIEALESALRVSTEPQRVIVQRTRLGLMLHRQRYPEAIAFGVKALEAMGYQLSAKPSMATVLLNVLAARRAMAGHPTTADELREMPSNSWNRDVLDLLILLSTPAYWTNQNLSVVIGLRLLRAAVRGGITSHSAMGYAHWAILNRVMFDDPARALHFGRLAEELLGPAPDPFVSSRVRFVVPAFVGPLMRTNRQNVRAYEEAYGECLRNGEHNFAAHCIDGIVVSLPLAQFRVTEMVDVLDECETRAKRVGGEPSLELIAIMRQWCHELRSQERPFLKTVGLQAEKSKADGFKNPVAIPLAHMLGMLSAYLDADYPRAMRHYDAIFRNRGFFASNPLISAVCASLMVSCLTRAEGRRRSRAVNVHLRRLRKLGELFRPNFAGMLLYAEAAVAHREGRTAHAIALLKEAVAEAAENANGLWHALACERLAAHYEVVDPAQQREFLAAAASGFRRWGAHERARRLAHSNPAIAELRALSQPAQAMSAGADIKVKALVETISAIAETRDVQVLSERLLGVLLAAAGARRGLLAREVHGEWRVVARAGAQDVLSENAASLEHTRQMPQSVVRYTLRTGAALLLKNPSDDVRFTDDPYFLPRAAAPRAVLCSPIQHRGRTSILLYLEHDQNDEAFTDERVQVVHIIGQHVAASIATADYLQLHLEAVQAKINPHFLYNTLSVVAELVFKDPAASESALLMLARLYRYMLGASWDQVVSLEQELSVVRDYLAIEKHRFGERLGFRIEVVGVIEDVQVPALLVQPIVENAVRHGIARKIEPGMVQIYVAREGDKCRVQVHDDGPGPVNDPTKAAGFGLRSVSKRLELLYGGDYRMTTTKGDGYAVELMFPVVVERR